MLPATIPIAVFLATRHPVTKPDGASPSAKHRPVEPAPPGEGVVQMLKDGRTQFELLDTDGVRHKASLVQIDGDNVVLQTGDGVFTIPVDQLQRSRRRGDSPWDGALVGLSVGGGLCALIAQSDPGSTIRWKSNNPDDWTMRDTISLLALSATVRYIIDALHVGTHTVFVGPMPASPSKPQGALTLNFAGPKRERQLQIGYRMTF